MAGQAGMVYKSGGWKPAESSGFIDPITQTKISDLSDKRLVQRFKSARESVAITQRVLAQTRKEAKNSGPEYAARILGIAQANFESAERTFKALEGEAQKRLAARRS